jgi:NADPH2:quinone reductase
MEYELPQAIATLQELAGWAAEGKIKPPVGTVYPFDQFGAAMEAALSGKGTGKVVLEVAADGRA